MIAFAKRGRCILAPDTRTDRDREHEVKLPDRVRVHVYPLKNEHGRWVAHALVETPCVETGESDYFGTKWEFGHDPTLAEVHQVASDFLAHEIRHQLGMPTHPDGPDLNKVDAIDECIRKLEDAAKHGTGSYQDAAWELRELRAALIKGER